MVNNFLLLGTKNFVITILQLAARSLSFYSKWFLVSLALLKDYRKLILPMLSQGAQDNLLAIRKVKIYSQNCILDNQKQKNFLTKNLHLFKFHINEFTCTLFSFTGTIHGFVKGEGFCFRSCDFYFP